MPAKKTPNFSSFCASMAPLARPYQGVLDTLKLV
jgi:hypothetical protein